MKKDKKMRTSVWVNPSLILLLNERGLDLSTFIGRILPMFLDLPEDPRDKMTQKNLEKAVLRLRSTYEQEIKQFLKEQATLEAEKIRASEPIKKIYVWDLATEEYREIPEDQFDPNWMKIRENPGVRV